MQSSLAFRSSVLAALLSLLTLPAVAQRTVTKDAGGGRKIVLHYNAADQITETDTLGPNGELLQKNVLDYKPGFYVAQSLDTSYWPNGKPHRVNQNSYDDNSNFLGEYLQIFDESGKQVGGHRLTHDPIANSYVCQEWDASAQKWTPHVCPAGEEAQGTPETAKVFTQQDVDQQLQRAHAAAAMPPAQTSASAPGSAATKVREVGLVLPSHIRPGDHVSGSVVENPAAYENNPQLIVMRVALPFGGEGKTSTLAGWTVEISGEPPQPADGTIALTIPPGQVALAAMFRTFNREGAPVAKEVNLSKASREKSRVGDGWWAPATCLKNDVCMIHGAFTGNSIQTFAALADKPAKILAETTTAAYVAMPDDVEPGQKALVVTEGAKAIAFPIVVSEFAIQPETRTFTKPDQMLLYVTLDGPSDVPDPEWTPGNYPPSNLDEARKLLPGYKLAKAGKEDHEAQERREKEAKAKGGAPEKEEGAGGEILVVVKCTTSDAITFRGAKDGMYVFHLNVDSFKMGAFKYKFVVAASKPGSFSVQGWAIPLLAPVKGQEFTASAK